MGNKCSATPSFTSEIIIEEDEPPDPIDDEGLLVTLLDTKNFSLANLESKNGEKLHALVRVSSSLSSQVYTKPIRSCSKDGVTQWHVPKRKFFISANSSTVLGEVKVCLLHTNLPPLPAVPSQCDNVPSCDKKNCKAVTLTSMTVPVNLEEIKTQKKIDRWITFETTFGEQSQVLVALEYVYRTQILKKRTNH